jgi:signal transduction histidine kinase
MAISDLTASSSGFRRHRTRRADRFSCNASRRNGHADRGTFSSDRHHGSVLGTDFDRNRRAMSSSQPARVTSAPSETGAFYADCFARRDSDAAPASFGRTHTKVAAQNALRLTAQTKSTLESDIHSEERSKERARIVQELHDTLLQGFLGASMVLHHAVAQTPADSPSKPALSRALQLVHRAIDEGRAAMQGLCTASPAPSSVEQAFSNLLREAKTASGPRLRIFIQGKPRTLSPAIQDQVFLIGREAVMNALRHSEATEIEVEVQYLADLLRVFVRDDGCGINPEAVQKKSDSHWGLRGMRDRAENVGARFEIRSRPGGGTEVRLSLRLTSRAIDRGL